MILIERGGNADDNGIHRRHSRVVCGGFKTMRPRFLNLGRRDAVNIRSTLRQGGHFALVNVKTGDREFLLSVEQRQG